MRWLLYIPLTFAILLAGPLVAMATGIVNWGGDWRTASREPVGLAPDPATTPEAVVQVYAARAFGWRAAFAVHSWVAVKPSGAPGYTVLEVNGWRAYRGLPVIAVSERPADSEWFGAKPELLAEARGPLAETMIPRMRQAVASYPYPESYRAWPGPNSNTFVAHILRHVPELRVDLPPTAVGKDFLEAPFAAAAPSGTGFQLSLFGIMGLLAARDEGLELNLLGLTFGIDPVDLGIKIPGLGRFALRRGQTTVTPSS